jgi:hypothetical protein
LPAKVYFYVIYHKLFFPKLNFVQLKILKGMSSDVVRLRVERNKFQTNRAIKAYSLYTWLKNMTRAGYIHHYEKQLPDICKALKISRTSFYNYLREAESLNLIKRGRGRLQLSSWDFVAEELFIVDKTFTTINYDLDNRKQKLHHCIEALEFEENREKQNTAVAHKIAKNPQVKSAFDLWCSTNNVQLPFNLENLAKVRTKIFASGSAASIYPALMYSVNPEFYRNSCTIAKAHNYKSQLLTTYLKKKLQLAGLIIVRKGAQTACMYNKDKKKGRERGKNELGTTFYKVKDKANIWYEPDKVSVSPFLIHQPGAEEQKMTPETLISHPSKTNLKPAPGLHVQKL